MATTIKLDDNLLARLENKAKKQQLSAEQLAIRILTEAVEDSESIAPRDVVTRIQATTPNPSQVRPATANLEVLLNSAPGDPGFELETWRRQWSLVEADFPGDVNRRYRPVGKRSR